MITILVLHRFNFIPHLLMGCPCQLTRIILPHFQVNKAYLAQQIITLFNSNQSTPFKTNHE